MFNCEKPILTNSEDLLGFSKVAKDLSDKICSYSDEESLTIGVVGEWGSGKTSFINLTLENLKDDDDFIVVKFNPWNISTRKQLISDFFNLLASEVGMEDNDKTLNEIGKDLKIFSKVIKPLSMIPSISIVANGLGAMTEGISEAIDAYTGSDEVNLDEIKERLDQKLIEYRKKIIIVIDDIDRLVDEEIREVFQLVRSIADFKNTIYLLSYDDSIVTRALDNLQKEKGDKYLEKIVQIPLLLPHVGRDEINNIFLQRLDRILGLYEGEFDRSYFSELYHNGLANNFNNLRDIGRYFNVLTFGVELAKEELNIYDYIAITLINVMEPELYRYIQENEESFAGTSFGGTFGLQEKENKEKIKADLGRLFEGVKKMSSKNIQELVQTLFPKIKGLYQNSSYAFGFESQWSSKRRIASSNFFQIYFKRNFPKNEIKKSEIETIKNGASREDLKKIFMVNNTKRLKLLDRILDVADEINRDKIVEFLQFILSLTDELKFEGAVGIFSSLEKPRYKVSRIFFKAIKTIEVAQRFETIEEIFKDESCSLESLATIIDTFKKDMTERNGVSDYGIRNDEIQKLTNTLSGRLLKRSKEQEYIPKGFLKVLYAMRRLDKEEVAKQVFHNYVQSDDLLMPLLESMVSVSIHETGYTVSENKYISKENIDNFCDYNELVKRVDEVIINPNDEEKELIGYLKNAKTSKELNRF